MKSFTGRERSPGSASCVLAGTLLLFVVTLVAAVPNVAYSSYGCHLSPMDVVYQASGFVANGIFLLGTLVFLSLRTWTDVSRRANAIGQGLAIRRFGTASLLFALVHLPAYVSPFPLATGSALGGVLLGVVYGVIYHFECTIQGLGTRRTEYSGTGQPISQVWPASPRIPGSCY